MGKNLFSGTKTLSVKQSPNEFYDPYIQLRPRQRRAMLTKQKLAEKLKAKEQSA